MTSHSASSHSFTPPMAEETVEKTSQRVQMSIRDVGLIARDLLKGARSEEALTSCAKQFANLESTMEASALQVSKLELFSQQISLHEESMEAALTNVEALEEILRRISTIPSRACGETGMSKQT